MGAIMCAATRARTASSRILKNRIWKLMVEHLRVAARFSGRSAIDVLGGCVGLGDSFDLVMTASPVVRSGAIGLKDVKITTDARFLLHPAGAGRVGAEHFEGFENRGVAIRLAKCWSSRAARIRPELAAFDLTEIRIKPDALVLVIEFRMVIK